MFTSLLNLTASTTKIFRQMGYGISKRNKLYQHYWSKHQQQCFALQKQWIEATEVTSQSYVLGAGFLFDLDQQLFGKTFTKLTLIDGNPRCGRYWKKFSNNKSVVVESRVEEISGVIDDWELQLRLQLKASVSWQDALAIVRDFAQKPLPRSSFFADLSSASVVSLNLLSQLPLAWQEIVERCLGKVFGKSFVVQHQDEWVEAFLGSARLLVEQHLRDLIESQARSILIISDREYCNYRLPKYFRGRQPVVAYHKDYGWQRDAAALSSEVELEIEITPALYGVELQSWSDKLAPCYKVGPIDTWLWHIAPPGAEGVNRGLSHLVQGFFLSRV